LRLATTISTLMFTRAIVRPPAPNFAQGLTTADLSTPDYQRALKQHEDYCAALERCGLTLITLAADSHYPDSTFVEDTAVLTKRCAVLTLPGAPSRAGEVSGIADVLADFYPSIFSIEPPGTLDGGDVCEAGNHFFIGISERTNEAGARQLAGLLAPLGYTSSFVDIRADEMQSVPGALATGLISEGILHLKSGLSYLGDNRLAVIDALADRNEFSKYDLIRVSDDERYAANCIRVNDHLLVPSGYPGLERKLRDLGYSTIALEMTEFQKMDGGLSCLSLRF
jgi:dimethylargininase